MKRLFLLIILVLSFALADSPIAGNAYVISALGIKNTSDKVAYVSGDTSVSGNANYVLAPQVIIYQEGLSYVGSYTPFTGCLSSKHYTNGAPDGLCITGIINDLTTGGTDKALSAEQGKILNEKVSDLQIKTRINYLRPTLQTTTKNGVTLTNNSDGTYTLSGTPTQDIIEFYIGDITLNSGTYSLTGTPKNYSETHLFARIPNQNDADSRDGKGAIFTISGKTTIYLYIVARLSDTTLDNVLLKPMITDDLDATYDDFVPYEQSFATNSSVKDIMKWKLIYKDSVGPNGIDLSISDEYNELLFEYGTKNSDQVYGGGSVVMAKNSNHPMWVPLFAWNKESFIDVVYAFWIGNTLRISTTNNTINYQVWAR